MGKFSRLQDGVELWLQWIIVTGISWTLCFLAAAGLMSELRLDLPESWQLSLIGLIGGSLVGWAQRHILSLDSRETAVWLGATAVGWTFGILSSTALIAGSHSTWHWLLAGLTSGMVSGIIQAQAINAQLSVRGLWAIMSSVSWAAVYATGSLPVQSDLINARTFGHATSATAGIFGWVVMSLMATMLLVIFIPRALQKDHTEQARWWP